MHNQASAPYTLARAFTDAPCPSDVVERSSIIEASAVDDAKQSAADALTEHGFCEWSDLAEAHRLEIELHLDRLPPSSCRDGERLLMATRRFFTTPYWGQTIASGWLITDVFGCPEWDPQRRDMLGLVPFASAAPKRGRRLVEITEAGATFEDPDGRRHSFFRPTLHHDAGALCKWWNCPTLVNLEAA